jgi:predicted ATPase
VMESAMCDPAGSACLFFVGTYRSNEVDDDHEIFGLVRRLKSFGVPTTMVSLEGLDPKNLNTMISDALCMLPRACTSLSDIVYQKTKGNPFFVLAFLRSLVDGRYLWYCVDGRRWIWDEDHVSSLDVTGNVLHLLSSKMTGLSTSMQSALKVAACFGIRIEQSVVSTLVDDPEFADIRDNLVRVVREGFMVMSRSSDFKFVHDKVREAAYGLIPEMDRDAVSGLSIVIFVIWIAHPPNPLPNEFTSRTFICQSTITR